MRRVTLRSERRETCPSQQAAQQLAFALRVWLHPEVVLDLPD